MNDMDSPRSTKKKHRLHGALALLAVLVLAGVVVPPKSGLAVPLPPSPVSLTSSISASVDAPEAIAAGSSFKVVFEARLTSPGTTVIQFAPIDPPSDACDLGSVEVMSGIDLGNNQYLLYNVPGTFSAAQEELQMHTLPPFVRLSAGYTTRANEGGTCTVTATVLRPLEVPAAPPVSLTDTVKVQLPAVPVVMGTIRTAGSWDIEDGATVTITAIPHFKLVCLPDSCAVELVGVASHTDGNDFGDYGRFWYSGPGVVPSNGMSISDETEAQPYHVVAEPNHVVEKWIRNDYCYLGQYVDGGPWGETWEVPKAETCLVLMVYEPKETETNPGILCDYFHDAPVQAQFAMGDPTVYIYAYTGPYAGSMFGLAKDTWSAACQDHGPGAIESPAPAKVTHLVDYIIPERPIEPIDARHLVPEIEKPSCPGAKDPC